MRETPIALIIPESFSSSAPSKEDLCIEVSPLTLATCESMAEMLTKTRGAALMIDYGEDRTQADTLRGFKKHKQVSVLSEPGNVDVTADVDFFMCAKTLANKGVRVLPLFTQREFLLRMGIVERIESLVSSDDCSDEQAEEVVGAAKRLLSDDQMGLRYKALVFTSKGLQIPPLEASDDETVQ